MRAGCCIQLSWFSDRALAAQAGGVQLPEGEREGGREGGREGERKGGREKERKERKRCSQLPTINLFILTQLVSLKNSCRGCGVFGFTSKEKRYFQGEMLLQVCRVVRIWDEDQPRPK